MEDYQAAYEQRAGDTEALHSGNRHNAVVHFGGITMECLLKAIIVNYHGISEWKTDGNTESHGVTNPGHSLIEAIKRVNKLKSRMERTPPMLDLLNKIENPSLHYIDMRYVGEEMPEDRYLAWRDAYLRLKNWILLQATQL